MQRLTAKQQSDLNKSLIDSIERLGRSIRRSKIQVEHNNDLALTDYCDMACEIIEKQAELIERMRKSEGGIK